MRRVHWFAELHEYLCQLRDARVDNKKIKEKKLEEAEIWCGTDHADQSNRRTVARISRVHDCTTGFAVGRRSFFRRYAENTSIGGPRTRTYIIRHVDTYIHTHIRAYIRTLIRLCARIWSVREMDAYSTHVPCKPALIFHVCAITRDPFRGPGAHRIKVHYDNHIRYCDAGHIPY